MEIRDSTVQAGNGSHEAAASLSSPEIKQRSIALWKRGLPYTGTLLIFLFIFWRIPLAKVGAALEHAPVVDLFAIFLPFSVLYWIIDSLCLTWVIRRFNALLRVREILPIRASMYLLAMINTNLGQGGVAWYVHRKARVPFLEVLSSILFIALMEIYQLFLFSTLGVLFYRAASPAQAQLVGALRLAYAIGWFALIILIAFFARARKSFRLRGWIKNARFGGIADTFLDARPIDYAIVLGIKAPSFLASVLTHYFALSLFGIGIPLLKLMVFLPLVFLAAALPIAVAHLGTSQAAWLLFFSGNAPAADILAYSLVAHLTFMLCNGLIGLLFLPHASRELTSVNGGAAAASKSG
jgi:lysylphosphatidylglycerol synthase-like protein